ncbi:MarR family winged helix-turn-helix transcriptional regulator, partial [Roseomonas sp. 18066]|uniref:MarR family winged helix-turn-helix transcriptional regulator n=1 Tax=Roseomonas sp. 18066 TaxID=2681412 RepID=UPI00190FA72F
PSPSLPADAALRRRFGAHFIVITRAWRREADLRLAPLGLSHATASALLLLQRQPGAGLRQGALAGALGIEQPSLVPLLDQLGAAGLVERRPDPADRRARSLHLTEAGAAAAATADAALEELRAGVLQGCGASELATAMQVLERMAENLGREPGDLS